MKLTRLVSWFDRHTLELVGELDIDDIELGILKAIFTPKPDDPLLYDPYNISEKEMKLLLSYTNSIKTC